MSKTIGEIQKKIMKQAEEKRWGVSPDEIHVGEKIALIHSEVSEAFEEYRKDNLKGIDGMDGELASTVIRIFHLAGIMGFDLEPLIKAKLERNAGRNWEWDKLKEGKNG